MLLRYLEDVKRVLSRLRGTMVGVGITAFSRMALAGLVPSYRIVCGRDTSDMEALQEVVPVWCLERDAGKRLPPTGLDSYSILSHPNTLRFLDGLRRPVSLFLYQSYSRLEALAKGQGWLLLANRASLRGQVGDREFFQRLVGSLGLPAIAGGIYPMEALLERQYRHWRSRLGPRLVIQLPEVDKGGGKGTFFVDTEEDYEGLKQRLEKRRWRGVSVNKVAIFRKLDSVPCSITLCITRHGVLMGPLQIQFVDMALDVLEKGVFCGHSWGGYRWPQDLGEKARAQALAIGNFLKKMGYKGLAGLDFLADIDGGDLYPKEINPRLTGALPMLSMLFVAQGMIPFEAFHVLEFLNIPYEIDLEALNESYSESPAGSHAIVHLGSAPASINAPGLKAGRYIPGTGGSQEFTYNGPGWAYWHMESNSEMVVVDGPPSAGLGHLEVEDPLFRLCKILFPEPEFDEFLGPSSFIRRAVRWVREKILTTI